MKRSLILVLLGLYTQFCFAQGESVSNIHLPAANRGKAVNYNSLGVGALPATHLMLGGNHISYRNFGFGVSWRVGLKNIQRSREGFSSLDYDTASNRGWLTGNIQLGYSFSANLNFVVALTRKIPLYMGVGVVEERHFSEIQSPMKAPGETEWQINPHATGLKVNFGAGVFIPSYKRLVLNVGYDHLPQTVFVGLCISGPYNYEDIDMW